MNDVLLGVVMIILGFITVPLTEGDATFLLFAIPLGIALIFKNLKIPGGNRGKNKVYNEE